MSLSSHQKAILALVIANLIWGAASPLFKWSLTNIEPFTLAFLRFSLASLIIFPFAYRFLRVSKEHWIQLLILSLAGITLNISFFFFGLRLAPSINAPIIATAGPMFLLAGCLLFLKEKIRTKVLVGTSIGFAGIVIIVLRPLLENGFNMAVLGNLFFIVATLGAVIQIIFVKKLALHYHAVTITFWSFVIGALTFLPPFALEVKNTGFLQNLALPGLTGILFGVLLSSALAYFLYHWAIEKLLAQEVGVFAYLDPIVAIFIAIPLLGEVPTPTYLLGSIFVFAGIFIAEGRIPYHPFQKWKQPTS